MRTLLQSPKGKIGAAVAGCPRPRRRRAGSCSSPRNARRRQTSRRSSTASRAELLQRRTALAQPSASVTVKPSDLYRLTKALPDKTGHGGNPARRQSPRRPQRARVQRDHAAADQLGSGYVMHPLSVVVQGRFGDVSRFLGDVRTLVTVRKGRLDSRGRLYSVSQVDVSAARLGQELPGRQGDGDAERLRVQRAGSDDARPVNDHRLVLERDSRSRSDPLMAKNRQAQDAAAKAKKQKIMLVVFGVALLAVAVLQGPKLIKQLNPPRRRPLPSWTAARPCRPPRPPSRGRHRRRAGQPSAPSGPRSSRV